MGGWTHGRIGGWALAALAALIAGSGFVLPSAHPPIRPSVDIHAEYVKYASGSDTITAYLAYP